MQKIVSNVSSQIYTKVAKPILFKQKPDIVHDRMLQAGSRLQKISSFRYFMHGAFAYENSVLEQEVLGIHFRNPVGLSAGFDKNFELPPLLKSIGFGFMEGGSLTLKECSGNPKPWFYRLPKSQSLVVNAGLANQGVVKIVKRLKSYPKNTFDDFPLNISVAKTNSQASATDADAIDDYAGSLEYLKKSGIGKIITINISCPNAYGGEPFTTPKRLDQLLRKVDKVNLSQPVFVKMPSDLAWPAFDDLLNIIIKHHVAGVTISNLAKDRKNIKLSDPLPETVKGNLSGKPVWDLSNNLIRQTYKKYGKHLVISGVGGIFSAEDAYTKIKLGATLVELVTGLIFQGPPLIGQINKGLVALLEHDGYKTISEAIGVDA
ncbi:MAG TPA: quinone-dependent dihydroorotate dehydrogenase [Patescibacteria group bacterium]|jgi:dihydroorotate dehydrogenase (fumarate)|nr:quinone-dependent dihydroorotate dehydrogenase [Patescibacteria group bacterium]